MKSIFEFGLFPLLRGIVLLLFPTNLCYHFFKGVDNNVHIGFSLIIVKKLNLSAGTKISSFNLIRCQSLQSGENTRISRSNIIYTNGCIRLDPYSSIGKRNKFTSPIDKTVYISRSKLNLGKKAIITSDHFFDLTDSIFIGESAVIAGKYSQFWTHSYTHTNHDRYRTDGSIFIGSNSYIGSRTIFLASTGIADHVQVGAGTIISKFYEKRDKIIVGAGVRVFDFIDKKNYLTKISSEHNCEEVFKK